MNEHSPKFFANRKRDREEIQKARELGVSEAEILDLRLQAQMEEIRPKLQKHNEEIMDRIKAHLIELEESYKNVMRYFAERRKRFERVEREVLEEMEKIENTENHSDDDERKNSHNEGGLFF